MYNFVIFTIFHIFWSENVVRFFFSFCQFSWFFQCDNFRMFWPTVQNCEDDVASFNLRAAHVVLRSKLFAWRKLLIISRTTNLEKNGALISRPNKVWHSFERAAQNEISRITFSSEEVTKKFLGMSWIMITLKYHKVGLEQIEKSEKYQNVQQNVFLQSYPFLLI